MAALRLVSLAALLLLACSAVLAAVPYITTQPTNQFVAAGTPATFSFAYANLPGAVNQWFVSFNRGVSFVPIPAPAGTQLTYTFMPPSTQTNNYDGYQFYASATANGVTLTTNVVSISIVKAPFIILQPQDALAVSGAVATFNVTAAAQTSINYQWQVSLDGGLTWSNVAAGTSAVTSGTSSIYQVTTSPTNLFNRFRVVLTAAGTSLATTSNVAVLRVAFITVSSPPSSATVNEGQQASFSVAYTSYPPANVLWKLSSAGALVDVPGGSGDQTTTYTTVPTQYSMNGYQFTATISNAYVTASAGPASLTVNRRLVILQQPQNATVSAPAGTSFSVQATGTSPITYIWQLSTDGGKTWSSTLLDPATAFTTALSVPSTTRFMNQYQYRVLVSITDALGTLTLTSSTAYLTVLYAPVILTQPLRPLVVTQDLVTLVVVVDANPPATFQWQSSQVNSPALFTNIAVDSTGPSYRVISVPVLDSIYYRVVCSNSQGTVISNVVELRVDFPRNPF